MFIIIFDYNSWYVNIKITLLLKLLKYNHNYIFLSDVLWFKSLLKSTWNLKHFCEPTRPVLVFTPLRLEVEVSTGGARTGARQVGRGTGPSRIYRHHDRRMKRLERMLTEEKKKRRREEETGRRKRDKILRRSTGWWWTIRNINWSLDVQLVHVTLARPAVAFLRCDLKTKKTQVSSSDKTFLRQARPC